MCKVYNSVAVQTTTRVAYLSIYKVCITPTPLIHTPQNRLSQTDFSTIHRNDQLFHKGKAKTS